MFAVILDCEVANIFILIPLLFAGERRSVFDMSMERMG